MIGSVLILLTAIGQAPPGADGPALSTSPKQWFTITSPVDGKVTQILGWMRNGRVEYDPRDYPQFFKAPTPPRPNTPVTPPAPAPAISAPPQMPTGVVADKLPHVRPGGAWYGGNAPHPVGEAGRDVTPPRKPEVYMTVIGTHAERASFLAGLERDSDYRQLAGEMGERLAVNEYDPANPMVTGVGLPAGGKPDVVVQDASGREIDRHAKDPGAKVVIAAIRRADPSYRPGGGHSLESTIPEWAVLAVGGVAAYLIYLGLSARKAAGQ